MTRRKTRKGPAANPAPRPPRQSVGKSKAIIKFNELQTEFASHLSDNTEDKQGAFAQAFLFLLRDCYAGCVLFDAEELGIVLNLLFRSARIQARWTDIGHLENSLDELMPEMRGLVVRLIAFKAIIRDQPAWQHFEELLPDRFLFAVFEAFNGDRPVPPLFKSATSHRGHRNTNFAGLLFMPGGQHG